MCCVQTAVWLSQTSGLSSVWEGQRSCHCLPASVSMRQLRVCSNARAKMGIYSLFLRVSARVRL